MLSDINYQINIHDDILIYGKTQREHDDTVDKVLARLQHLGLTINLKKCVFNTSYVDFFGVRFTSEGMQPDPTKVATLRNSKPPKNKSELKSFPGMTDFRSRFVQNYAEKTRVLRELLTKDATWVWTENHMEAFRHLTTCLLRETVLG